MSTVIPYIIHIWTPLRWYVKVILILILLRIVNTIYRVFFESSNAKQKREKQENEVEALPAGVVENLRNCGLQENHIAVGGIF